MFNNKKRGNDLNNIFSTPFGENELLEDEDEDFENMHNKIQKSKKYIEKNPNFSNYNDC